MSDTGRTIGRSVVVERSSVLPVPRAEVWARVTDWAGIRDELRPVLGMTVPPGLRGRTLADAQDLVGRPLGRSWLLLLGVLPVDADDMVLAEVEPGRRFHERSRMLSLPAWEHERTLEDVEGGCRVTDRLTFTPRLARLAPAPWLSGHLVGALFSHRHRRLRRWAQR